MTIEDLRNNKLILFETISGSRAYGTSLPTSDTDIRGVFILPHDDILGNKYVDQVSDKMNDITFYEIGRFLELLKTNNPTVLELLNAPEDCIQFKHPVFDEILKNRDKFITKQCRHSFGGYAVAQIKKARGLNKKINNPMEVKRKTSIDFCNVIEEHKSTGLSKWLDDRKLLENKCGIVNIPNARDMYALFYDEHGHLKYKGIESQDANQLKLSSIPKDIKPLTTFSYNKDGYTTHCKDYKEYWTWVNNRNETRYNDNMNHGKGYDGKNLMHCHRLLDMSLEILEGKGINVRRPNREELLDIRRGEKDYDELVSDAEAKLELMDNLYKGNKLPKFVDDTFVTNLLIKIRKSIYEL